jgi:transcriptional regulator with XRE-family HTH domain
LGLSQAQLGQLVGRSASSIRSWERDVSVPTDASVITALSAILDLDKQSLFEKAGVEVPVEEAHPTVEEALASLAPLPLEDGPAPEPEEETFHLAGLDGLLPVSAPGPTHEAETVLDLDFELEAEAREHRDESPTWLPEAQPMVESNSPRPDLVGAAAMNRAAEPAFTSPPEPFAITAPTPPVNEPSYMEDTQQRQLYRVRHLATVVLVVALIVVFLWSLSNTMDALGSWWDDFFGSLRL